MSTVVPLVLGPDCTSALVDPRKGSGKIFIEDTGARDGDTLICFPGIGDVRTSFRFVADEFRNTCRIVVADLRGIGDSQGFSSFTPEDVADDVRSVIDYLKLQGNVVLVANSLSAGSAMLVASEGHPAVKGVILLGPIMHDMPGDKYFRPLSHVLFVWPWGGWLWSQYYSSLYKRSTRPPGYPEHLKTINTCIRRSGALGSVGKFVRATKRNVEANLHRVKLPVLAIYGDQDPDYPNVPEEVALISKLMEGGAFKSAVLQQVGHYPHVEAAEESMQLIRDFLATLRQ